MVLLDGITGTNNGSWVGCEVLASKTIHIKGVTTATLHICGSLAPVKPADTAHEIQIGDDITADCLVEIPAHLKWIKVRCSAYTAGTIYAYLEGK